MLLKSAEDIFEYLKRFTLNQNLDIYIDNAPTTKTENILINETLFTQYINEFWTSKQRQASSIHEISYRACFKAQLPRFFINLFTKKNDIVYDPFSGRGTTVIEAGLLGRKIISNDINPLSEILAAPRFFIPNLKDIEDRLMQIPIDNKLRADIDLSMFYHPDTEAELVSLKVYLMKQKEKGAENYIDKWIRMVATNRLTGHSKGFFSVYTLPPNQAISPERQVKINKKRNQHPDYRNTHKLVFKKSNSLLQNLTDTQKQYLKTAGESALFLQKDARNTVEIASESVQLTVTSPPFLDIVQYSKDNWLRCWFNSIDVEEISKKITMAKTIENWSAVMQAVFKELYRITKIGGWVAFEVGEVKKGTIKLDEYVVPLGLKAGFQCEGILVNSQEFTKTSNIWGINNMDSGTNTNRIVLFHRKEK
ncbi:MAG TPA: DNA methyltransferase [Candidatus Deferrimicrobium sp.]|nr:DNA methyltransferase [Candidatus Deferrimicrobium sp.]